MTLKTSQNGTTWGTATLNPTVSIVPECRISAMPPTLNLNYVSFTTSSVSASSNFDISCTQGTPYTMALDATSGTLLGLNYQIALNTSSGTGTAFAQSYSVTATMAGNQSGTCSAGTCSATATRTITVSY